MESHYEEREKSEPLGRVAMMGLLSDGMLYFDRH